MKLRKIVSAVSVAMLSGVLLTGCGSDSDSDDGTTAVNILTKSQAVINSNADVAYAAYSDAVTTAEELLATIKVMGVGVTNETYAEKIEAAKTAWLVAREAYGSTEVFRFRASPIDSTDYATVGIDAANEEGPEGSINAWPLGEALIDYTQKGDDFGNDELGVTEHATSVAGGNAILDDVIFTGGNTDATDNTIIGNTAITLDADLLANTATAEDEHDVISGYHAVEFLLWGQDLNQETVDSDTTTDADTPRDATAGYRLFTDFYDYDVTTQVISSDYSDGYDSTNLKHRRLKYLDVAASLLVKELKVVRDEWKEGGAYRVAFTAVDDQGSANTKMIEILTGMAKLSFGELASERMLVALRQDSQEDEHSCFSDNTHRDVVLNAQGVEMSYYGDYKGYDRNLDGVINSEDGDGVANAVMGTGFDELLALMDADNVAEVFETKLEKTKVGYVAIDDLARNQSTPFDLQIGADDVTSTKVYETAMALIDQGLFIQDELVEAMDLDAEINAQDDATCVEDGSCDL